MSWRLVAGIPPQYAVTAFFGLLLLLLRQVYPLPVQPAPFSVRYTVFMIAVFVAAAILVGALRRLRPLAGDRRPHGLRLVVAMLRDWFPFLLALWVYENLHDLTMRICPDTVDAQLARADAWLFGVQPTVWLERHATPLLTDYMALAYMTYFVFPPLLAGWLYFRGHVAAFHELQLALLTAFFGGFFGYVMVPAVGPQLIIADRYRSPLVGRYFFWSAKAMVTRLQDFPRDCFPSLHTAVSSVTLYFFFRNHRRIPLRHVVAVVVTVLTASLWVSTVYLRYHWVVDVFAGWGLSVLSCASGVMLHRHWPRPAAAPAAAIDIAVPSADDQHLALQ